MAQFPYQHLNNTNQISNMAPSRAPPGAAQASSSGITTGAVSRTPGGAARTPASSGRTPVPSRERERKPQEVIEESEKQWIYTPEELLRAPSICDGLPAAEEQLLRYKAYNFITQVGIALKLPQTTISSAGVFMNRFLMRYSLKKGRADGLPDLGKLQHHYQIAATSLFLATKIDETCRKVRELVIACCRVAQKNPHLVIDENNKDYWKWRDTILNNEDLLLELLAFDLNLESPYRLLFEMLQAYGVEKQKGLRDAAWAFINDAGMTQACLLFESRVVAASGLYFAAKATGTSFEDGKHDMPWWETQRVAGIKLRRCLEYMADFYTSPPGGIQVKSAAGGESAYKSIREGIGESQVDPTRLPNSASPGMDTPGSETTSANGKRSREEEHSSRPQSHNGTSDVRTHEMSAGSSTNGIASRIPAVARGDESPSKRQKLNNHTPTNGNTIGDPSASHSAAEEAEEVGSEEGEVEG